MNKPTLTALALFVALGTAYAATAPTFKEGFWKVHVVSTDGPGTPSTATDYSICRNHAFDQHSNDIRNSQPGCTTTSDTTQGNKHFITSVCKVAGSTITTKEVITTFSDDSVRGDSSATFTPAFDGKTQETMVMDQTFAGACPANLQPGDRVNADGRVMHLWKH